MISRSRSRNCRESGNELVEFAFVLPLFLGLILAVIWVGGVFSTYETVNRAAREGARFAVAPACATCGSATPYASPDQIDTVISQYLQQAHVDPAGIQAYTPPNMTACPGAAGPACAAPTLHNITVCQNVVLNTTGSGPQQCGVAVGFAYRTPFSFSISSSASSALNLPSVTLKAAVQMVREDRQ